MPEIGLAYRVSRCAVMARLAAETILFSASASLSKTSSASSGSWTSTAGSVAMLLRVGRLGRVIGRFPSSVEVFRGGCEAAGKQSTKTDRALAGDGGRLTHGLPHRSSQTPSRLREADRKSTRLNSSHLVISYAVFCLKKKNIIHKNT